MNWKGKKIVDLARTFLDSGGITARTAVTVEAPSEAGFFSNRKDISRTIAENPDNLKDSWLNILGDLNVCAQHGLGERFDSTIGSGTVLLPFGGSYQLTPSEVIDIWPFTTHFCGHLRAVLT